MLSTHVNLCDLLDSANQGKRVRIFNNVHDLRKYTLETQRIFPKEEAYAGGLLRYLLREIVGTYNGPNRRRTRRSRR
jgi:hypothetical protein